MLITEMILLTAIPTANPPVTNCCGVMFPNCFIAKPTPIAKRGSSKTNILNDLSNGIVSEFASILDDSAIAYDN
jgi:hypothetical protein